MFHVVLFGKACLLVSYLDLQFPELGLLENSGSSRQITKKAYSLCINGGEDKTMIT